MLRCSTVHAIATILVLLALAGPALSWPMSPAAHALSTALEGDGERAAVVVHFAGAPAVTCRADTRARTVVVDFAGARGEPRLLAPGELVEAAGLEPLGRDTLRLVVRVRRGATVSVLGSDPAAPTYACAVVVTDETPDVGPAGIALTWPVRGRVSSRYGMRLHPILHEHRMHQGVDIAVPTGTPIRAMKSGTVAFAGWKGASGLCVIVRHTNGMESKRHQILAEAGSTGMSTGSHLHFTVSENGKQIDPAKLMKKRIVARP
jgi:murein DD-endopeptidase MepM/ murein hydrolase activator NlpD